MKTITLPLKQAVELAVKENIERDRRCGLLESVLVSPDERAIYEKEAEHLLRTTGENYTPEYADHHHIMVANAELCCERRESERAPG
jgi:hypothetical protein